MLTCAKILISHITVMNIMISQCLMYLCMVNSVCYPPPPRFGDFISKMSIPYPWVTGQIKKANSPPHCAIYLNHTGGVHYVVLEVNFIQVLQMNYTMPKDLGK
jgi:hypothetical protein